jgi:hypothetical protein
MIAELQDCDFHVANHGSICILNCISEAAEVWANQHLPDDAQRWGSTGIVVEPRYLGPIIEGIEADGLIVTGV